MPMTPSAARAGSYRLGQHIVNRLGFGAMRLTGSGVWGPPDDLDECKRVLRRLRDLDINFIDTADAYGPDDSEQLLAQVLSPYDNFLIATKGGLARTGPGIWIPLGRPEYLRQQVHKSLRNLKVERLDLWQLHRLDPKVPRDEQFGAIREFLDEGLIAAAGLSEVSIEEIEAAHRIFPVASVQNRYNLIDRTSEAVLDHCEAHGIAFIPWFPLAAGDLVRQGSLLDAVAAKHGASPSQIALAWVLKRSPVILPIPGTSKVLHLEENVAAAEIDLSDEDFVALETEGRLQFTRKKA